MEKKNYEAPATEVVEIESEGILCASGLTGSGIEGYDELEW